MGETKQRESTGRHAVLVSTGILLTRLVGLARQRIFSSCFGLSDIAVIESEDGILVMNLKSTESLSPLVREIESGKKKPPLDPVGITVYLIEKTPGVLGGQNYELNYPSGGGLLGGVECALC